MKYANNSSRFIDSGAGIGYIYLILIHTNCTCFGSTYTKIGTIQRRLAWPLRKDDTQIREAFHIFFPPETFVYNTAVIFQESFKAIL